MRLAGLTTAVLLCAGAAGCGGCSQQPHPAANAPATPPAPAGPMFDTPEYANWKRFPVGTAVKRRAVTTTDKSAGKVTSVNTYTLRALGEDVIEVVRDNTTHRDDSPPVTNTGDVNRIRRRFAIPAGMTADDFSKPSRGAKRTGTEELPILGKNYPTTVYEWADPTEAGPLRVKLWVCEDLPGRIAKQTMHQPNLGNTTVEEVVEVKVP